MSTAKSKGGRPTKYRAEYCEKVIEEAAKGKSLTEIAVGWGITRATLDNWAARSGRFLEALTRAKEAEMAYFESVGRSSMFSKDFNAAVWKKSVEARFRDKYTTVQKKEVTGANGGPIEVQSKASALIDEIAAE